VHIDSNTIANDFRLKALTGVIPSEAEGGRVEECEDRKTVSYKDNAWRGGKFFPSVEQGGGMRGKWAEVGKGISGGGTGGGESWSGWEEEERERGVVPLYWCV